MFNNNNNGTEESIEKNEYLKIEKQKIVETKGEPQNSNNGNINSESLKDEVKSDIQEPLKVKPDWNSYKKFSVDTGIYIVYDESNKNNNLIETSLKLEIEFYHNQDHIWLDGIPILEVSSDERPYKNSTISKLKHGIKKILDKINKLISEDNAKRISNNIGQSIKTIENIPKTSPMPSHIPRIIESEDELGQFKVGGIKPIDISDIPDYNLIKKFINYMVDISDSYPEYAFQNAVAILSAITRKRLYMSMMNSKIRLNLILLSLGQSGYARKSIGIRQATSILKGIDMSLHPEDFTPESMIAMTADIKEFRVVDRKTGIEEWIPSSISAPIDRKAERMLWKDEAGQFYAQLNMPHMMHLKELICKLYDGDTYYKEIKNERYRTTSESYFGINFATTYNSFHDHVLGTDTNTGFLPRHNIVNPDYNKQRKDMAETTEESIKAKTDIVDYIKLINTILGDFTKENRIYLSKNILKILNKWQAEREQYFKDKQDEKMSSFFARFQDNVLKVAALIELGNMVYYLKNRKHYKTGYDIIIYPNLDEPSNNNLPLNRFRIKEFRITSKSLLTAIRLYDNMYIPYTESIIKSISKSTLRNSFSSIYDLLESNTVMGRRDLMRSSSVKAKDIDEIINQFKEAGAVTEYIIKGKGNNDKHIYVWNKNTSVSYDFTPPELDKREEEDLKIVFVEAPVINVQITLPDRSVSDNNKTEDKIETKMVTDMDIKSNNPNVPPQWQTGEKLDDKW